MGRYFLLGGLEIILNASRFQPVFKRARFKHVSAILFKDKPSVEIFQLLTREMRLDTVAYR